MEQDAGHEEPLSQEEPAKYAFLNHSTDTLVNRLPPEVDNKPLARQKRKRTSPEDQAVLEAAYSRDPKPDKEARLKLVEQIALGEKEVQIWFQNRRQTSRRKSRPLLPHEIAQFQMARYGSSSFAEDESHEAPLGDDKAGSFSARQSSQGSEGSSEQHQSSQKEIFATQASSLDTNPSRLPSFSNISHESSEHLASRQSLPSLSQVLNNLDNGLPSNSSKHVLRKSGSFIRLSMTSEGAAKVITKESLSPSPPRPVATTEQKPNNARDPSPCRREEPRQASLKRSASGRSRDSRAWEFWCDKECRAELEEKAEKDGKGSAADAIGMMRAATSRKALQPIVYKQNSALSKHQPWLMRQMRPEGKRPGLQRAHTSEGRLQNANGHTKRKRTNKTGALDSSLSVHIPGNESDKENWSPGAETSTYSKKSQLSKVKMTGSGLDAENIAPENDPHIAAFMKGGRKSSRMPGDEELDCVHGLLSLSQGNWAAS